MKLFRFPARRLPIFFVALSCAPAFAQVEVFGHVGYSVSEDTTESAAFALDADGDPDLLLVSPLADRLLVLENVFPASLSSGLVERQSITFAPLSMPSFVAAADLDGDGDDDALVTLQGSDSLQIVRNDAGTLVPASSYATGAAPGALVSVDLTGDGAPDVALLDVGDDTLSIWHNDGFGGLLLSETFPAGDRPSDLEVADLDGDGDLDLVVCAADQGGLVFFHNTNAGLFTLGERIPSATSGETLAITLFDQDQDGALDVAMDIRTGNQGGGAEVFSGTAGGQFAYHGFLPCETFPIDVLGADFDLDGSDELAILGGGTFGLDRSVCIFDGPDGTFAGPMGCDGRLTAVDLDGDGDLDIINGGEVNFPASNLHVLFNIDDATQVASATVRNGAGGNALCFDIKLNERPMIGFAPNIDLDTSSNPSATIFVLVAYAGASDGFFTPFGELLVDLTSLQIDGIILPPASFFQISIPFDLSLVGTFVATQGALTGGGTTNLCNALDLILGW